MSRYSHINCSDASPTLAVAITGGIGSGKTVVCKILRKLGATVVYSDEIAKTIINTNATVRSRIQKVFGKKIYLPDGTLDRQQMAKLIFQDERLKEKLNAIVHPPVLEYLKKEIQRVKSVGKVPVYCVEAALIYEANANPMFDYVVVVNAPEEKRIERIMKRDGLSRSEVRQRFNAQIPVKEKVARADFVIQNTTDFEVLKQNCKFLYRLLTTISKQRRDERSSG